MKNIFYREGRILDFILQRISGDKFFNNNQLVVFFKVINDFWGTGDRGCVSLLIYVNVIDIEYFFYIYFMSFLMLNQVNPVRFIENSNYLIIGNRQSVCEIQVIRPF